MNNNENLNLSDFSPAFPGIRGERVESTSTKISSKHSWEESNNINIQSEFFIEYNNKKNYSQDEIITDFNIDEINSNHEI